MVFAENATPYPEKGQLFNDQALKDSGNFGRIARGGLMKDYVSKTMDTLVMGMPAKCWVEFLKMAANPSKRK